jgi:hypothetical protein
MSIIEFRVDRHLDHVPRYTLAWGGKWYTLSKSILIPNLTLPIDHEVSSSYPHLFLSNTSTPLAIAREYTWSSKHRRVIAALIVITIISIPFPLIMLLTYRQSDTQLRTSKDIDILLEFNHVITPKITVMIFGLGSIQSKSTKISKMRLIIQLTVTFNFLSFQVPTLYKI